MKHSTSGTIAKNELMLLRQSLERGVVQQGMSPKRGKNSKTQKGKCWQNRQCETLVVEAN